MNPIDAYSYIPSLATLGILFGIIIFLIIIIVRRTAHVSFVFFLAAACVMVGNIYTILKNSTFYLSAMVCVAALLLLPYCILKAVTKPAEKSHKSKDTGPIKGGKRVNVVYDDVERRLLEVNKDFMAHSTNGLSAPGGGFDQTLEYFGNQLIEFTHADGSMILLLDDYDDVISVKRLTGTFPPPYQLPDNIPHKQNRIEMSMKYAQFPLTDNIFGEVVKKITPLLITEPSKDDRIIQNGDEEFLKASSYIFVPIIVQEQAIGEIALAKEFQNDPFTEAEFDIAKKLSDFIGISIKEIKNHNEVVERSAVDKEGEIAVRIQKEVTPTKIPNIPGVSCGVYFNPTENICGDCYDILISRKDRIAFFLIDVTGKAINSMPVMLMVRAMLRLVTNTTQTAGTILSWANIGIASESFTKDHFASVSLMFYDSVNKKIQYSSGGTNPIYMYKASDESFSKISEDVEPIGVEKTTEFKNKEISVESGDIIITCTDGLIEALDTTGAQYSAKSLEKIIKQNHSLDGKAITERIKDDVKNFCGSAVQHDDQTFLVIKIQ